MEGILVMGVGVKWQEVNQEKYTRTRCCEVLEAEVTLNKWRSARTCTS